MKHLKVIFRIILGLFPTLLISIPANGQGEFPPEYFDSVEVSLLTCQPHDEVYSLYGHTAIRYRDTHREKPLDLAFNYGVFDFRKPHFVLRFVFGLTDYELGAYPFRHFLAEYRHFGSRVTEQLLNLSREEKHALQQALWANVRPENSVYRYNYFYNNCTTKARDIIEKCIRGRVEYAGRKGYSPTYREMVHQMTSDYPWAQFGNDMLLGLKADRPTTLRQQEFLPQNLMSDFSRARIVSDGGTRPLVSLTREALSAGVPVRQPGFPLTPAGCAAVMVLMGTVIFVWEIWRRKALLVWDLTLMTVSGVIGVVLTLMLFSQHPTVSLNLQIVFFNPLHLLCLWPVFRGRGRRYWMAVPLLFILFLGGMTLQDYATGIWSLAYCLLLQSYIHSDFTRKR